MDLYNTSSAASHASKLHVEVHTNPAILNSAQQYPTTLTGTQACLMVLSNTLNNTNNNTFNTK